MFAEIVHLPKRKVNFHLVVLLSLALFVAFYLLLVADLNHLTCTPKVVVVSSSSGSRSPQSTRWYENLKL